MKNTNKGFTLVELLVVIAMLAILSTVTVIGLTGCIEQAKLSVDQQEVEQMNTVLDASKVAGAPETIKELADLLKASNLNTKDGITASASGYAIYWFHNDKYNQIVLAKESDGSVHHPVDDAAMVTAFTTAQQANDASVYNLKKLAIGVFVGDTQYESLAAALAAEFANVDSVTIDLYNDEYFAEPVTIPAGKSLKLNLNGCSISSVMTENKGSALITNKGTLVINDSTGKGLITSDVTNPDMQEIPTYGNHTIANYGELIINGGTIECTGTGGATYAVDNHNKFTMNGGTLIGARCALRVAKYNYDNVEFTMNAGTITAPTPDWIQLPGSDASVAPTITVNINGGTLESTKESSEDNDVIYTYSYGNSHTNTTINIKGGYFLGGTVSIGSGYKGDVPTLNITGGTFEYDVLQWTEEGSVVRYSANK